MADCLINKIYYGNVTEEGGDVTISKLAGTACSLRVMGFGGGGCWRNTCTHSQGLKT